MLLMIREGGGGTCHGLHATRRLDPDPVHHVSAVEHVHFVPDRDDVRVLQPTAQTGDPWVIE